MECFKINTSKANVHSQSLKQHAGLCTRYSAYTLELLVFCFYVTPEWINGWSLILVTSLGLFFVCWFVLSNTQVRTLLFYIIRFYFDIDIFLKSELMNEYLAPGVKVNNRMQLLTSVTYLHQFSPVQWHWIYGPLWTGLVFRRSWPTYMDFTTSLCASIWLQFGML